MDYGFDRSWAEISLDHLAENFQNIVKFTGNKKMMSIVKCDAYGHGALMIAAKLQELGCTYMALCN